MCFTASRNDARLDTKGNILLLKQQDRTKWSRDFISRAIVHLNQSAATGESISKYHIEAGIAFEHAKALRYTDTNWEHILHYYNLLYQLFPTPIIALNRAIIISELYGPEKGIHAINSITGITTLKKYYLLPATLGELFWQLKEYDKAVQYFKEAIELTQSAAEKKLLEQKIRQERG